jgi:hypothetical protein
MFCFAAHLLIGVLALIGQRIAKRTCTNPRCQGCVACAFLVGEAAVTAALIG